MSLVSLGPAEGLTLADASYSILDFLLRRSLPCYSRQSARPRQRVATKHWWAVFFLRVRLIKPQASLQASIKAGVTSISILIVALGLWPLRDLIQDLRVSGD